MATVKEQFIGGTDRERRDRALGLALTLVGMWALFEVPEARHTATFMDGNAFGPQLIYLSWFALSFLAVIGPCIMLPHRAGALPLILASVFTVSQIHGEWTAPDLKQRLAQQAATHTVPERTGFGG